MGEVTFDLVHHFPEPLRLEVGLLLVSKPHIVWRIGPVSEIQSSEVPQASSVQVPQRKGRHMGVIINDMQRCRIGIGGLADAEGNEPQDPEGNPITITSVDWASSDTTVLDVASDPDDAAGLGGMATRVGPEGTAQAQAQISCSDGTSLVGVLDFQVIGSAPTSVQLQAGTPEPA